MLKLTWLGLWSGLALGGCAAPAAQVVHLPGGRPTASSPRWSAQELSKPIAVQTIGRTEHSSWHWVRATGAEQPHYHDRTDLSVFVTSGSVRVYLEGRSFSANAGDTVLIPKGTLHWVENVGAEASTSVAIFSPAFDGKDRRFLEAAAARE